MVSQNNERRPRKGCFLCKQKARAVTLAMRMLHYAYWFVVLYVVYIKAGELHVKVLPIFFLKCPYTLAMYTCTNFRRCKYTNKNQYKSTIHRFLTKKESIETDARSKEKTRV